MPLEQLRGDELGGLCILVVEDEPETLELVCMALRAAGADVTEAEAGEVALGILERAPPDVLVSDLQLPDIDGFAVVKRARERAGRRFGALALSASTGHDDTRRALEAGFDVHVAKPISIDELVAAVRAIAPQEGSGSCGEVPQ